MVWTVVDPPEPSPFVIPSDDDEEEDEGKEEEELSRDVIADDADNDVVTKLTSDGDCEVVVASPAVLPPPGDVPPPPGDVLPPPDDDVVDHVDDVDEVGED